MELREILVRIDSGPVGGKVVFTEFDAIYRKQLLRYLLRLRLSWEEAEDLLQEIYIKVFRNARKGLEFDSAEAWLWTIVHNSACDHFRKVGRIREKEVIFDDNDALEGSEIPPAADGVPGDDSIDECVDAGIKRYAEKMPARATALMMQLDGFSIREIADRIVRSEQATSQFLFESRRKLAPFIEHCRPLIGN
ncbi:MAG: RNA polymerase sigma factor [Gammaproteobacteria bacterium]|nr:RNA polymerase sigma factor [Gammaproteobacteria bacterium]